MAQVQWTKDDLETALSSEGWLLDSREIEHAVQFELKGNVKINLYDTGTLTFGGPKSDFKSTVETFVKAGPNSMEAEEQEPSVGNGKTQAHSEPERRVFVVYGHDTDARDDLELILRRVKVNPIILQNIPGVGDTLIEKLEALTDADFACVLLTADDIGAAKSTPDTLRPRARQNVVLELGMVLSRLGRRRVAILVKGEGLEKPSDIDGLIYIPFTLRVNEAANTLGAALASAGFEIDVRNLLGV